MAVLRLDTSDRTGPRYEQLCVADGCHRIVTMPVNGNLCTSCATKARKGITVTLKKGKTL